jgi:hypothetical protein
LYICTFVHLYICTFVHLYICTFVHLYICTFVHLYIHEHQENIARKEFVNGAHANNPLLHCDTCDQVPRCHISVQGLIPNRQFVSHAIMFVANKLVKEVITGMGAKYAKPSRRREKNLPAI